MKAKDKETLWLYFTMAYEAATRREFDEALAHSQKAVDMITLSGARKKQSQVAVDAIAFRDLRKSS
jgi:hypothetical protein